MPGAVWWTEQSLVFVTHPSVSFHPCYAYKEELACDVTWNESTESTFYNESLLFSLIKCLYFHLLA